jgi:hypothetical protein
VKGFKGSVWAWMTGPETSKAMGAMGEKLGGLDWAELAMGIAETAAKSRAEVLRANLSAKRGIAMSSDCGSKGTVYG